MEARPISYAGGSTLMAFSDDTRNSIYFHYSPSYKYSLGIEHINDKTVNKTYSFLRFTYLLKRHNTKISQRNLYFQSGVNSAGIENNFYGIHGDWETRKWFAGFSYKMIEAEKRQYSEKFVQIGVAPYLGDYGDLHTWLMLKTKKKILVGDWSTYPVLRFFKGNYFIEFGYSDETKWDAHLMYRF